MMGVPSSLIGIDFPAVFWLLVVVWAGRAGGEARLVYGLYCCSGGGRHGRRRGEEGGVRSVELRQIIMIGARIEAERAIIIFILAFVRLGSRVFWILHLCKYGGECEDGSFSQ